MCPSVQVKCIKCIHLYFFFFYRNVFILQTVITVEKINKKINHFLFTKYLFSTHSLQVCKQICLGIMAFLVKESPAVVGGRWLLLARAHIHTPTRPSARSRPLAIFGCLRLTSDASLSNGRPSSFGNHRVRLSELVTQSPVRPSFSNNKHSM